MCAGVSEIVIGANNVRLRMNGFTIDGVGSDEFEGIYLEGRRNVKIVGPGVIKEFRAENPYSRWTKKQYKKYCTYG